MAFGGAVKLQGEKEYREALSKITNNLKVISSEMKVVTSNFDKNSKSIDGLKKQNDLLTSKLDEEVNALNKAKQMLDKAKSSTDSNKETIQKWQVEVNKAQASVNKTSQELQKNTTEINKMERANISNTSELKKFEQAEKSASNQTSIFGDVLKANLAGDFIKTGITTMLNGIKQLSGAMLSLGKSSIQSYADYEQLVGGVDTLFGSNSKTVQEYANNAYKTAGLSANQYMETVTSFSASLLQSLGGDTAKSAKYADRAITDMSDNANKMGTDMSMIQNAYQGFAKQNYTMLDNLKLGYGGTKTEMQRLIADANKVKQANGEMADLSIDSFADVTEAIHIIQNEMGITGTTAKEASTTISGSINSVKSAWTNLLSGLANGNSDLGTLTNNLVDSVLTSVNNLVPAVETMANSVVQVLPNILNKIIKNILPVISNVLSTILNTLSENSSKIVPLIVDLLSGISNIILQNLPTILNMGIQIIVSLGQGISQQLPTLIPIMIQAVLDMVTTLLDNIDLIIDTGIQLTLGLADGLINALPDLIDKIPIIIEKLLTAITSNLPKLTEMGVQLTIKLGEGLIKAIPQLISKLPQIAMSIIRSIANYRVNMMEVGKNLIKGLWEGIKNVKDWVIDKIKGFGKSILDGLKKFFGIKSPSRLMRDMVGSNLAKGIGVGFEKEMKSVSKQMNSAVPTNFDTGISTREINNIKTSGNKNNDVSTLANLLNTNQPNPFNVTINNNSKYISASENAKQIRTNVQWYLLNQKRRGA